jgi:arylsulfatase A
MKRRDFLKALGLGAAAIAVPGVAGKILRAELTSQNKPNIVLFLVDDMGNFDVGCYGNEYYETPDIDKLAQQGMTFTNAYAACAVCSPTRAALMTGRYPARIGITDWIRSGDVEIDQNPTGYESIGELLTPRNHAFLEYEDVTIPELLKPLGYKTGHLGKWHLGGIPWYPETQGFDWAVGMNSRGSPATYFCPYSIESLLSCDDGGGLEEPEYLTDRLTDEAIGFIETAAGESKPFFLYMAHWAVHVPIQAKEDLIEYYEGKPIPEDRDFKPDYAAMVHSVNESVARITAKLDELGLAQNTIVIFYSDNGGYRHKTDNFPLRAGKGNPYEGGIREPMIVRWPGVVEPSSRCDEPITSVDFLPTICEIAGQSLPADRVIDGVSFMPLLKQTASLNRDAIFWHYPHYWGENEPKMVPPYSIVRSGHWKLIKWYETNTLELYNLRDDISETNDLAQKMPQKVRQLDKKLTDWLRDTGAKLPKRNPNSPIYKEKNQIRLGR